MTRRVIGCWLLMAATCAAEPARPNIVIFLADDLGWKDCSVNGGADARTPNIDRLAAQGMTLTRAFVASPSCAPSRAALLTSLDPMRTGAMLNHTRPRPSARRWPAYFHDLGYEVAAFGKVAHYGFVRDDGFDHASHFSYHQDDCVEAAIEWLKRRPAGKPLCLMVGTNWPHVPWPTDESALGRVSIPPTHVDTPETRSARARYLAAVANADRDLGLMLDATRAVFGDDALFLFTSDHGAQLPFGKWNLYDAGVRTPVIAAWPGRIKPGSTSDALVSWIDLLPTCLEAAGGEPPPSGPSDGQVSGRSFLPVLRGETDQHRDRIFLTHSGDGGMNQYPMRAVRRPQWKYIRNLNPAGEFHTHIDKAAAGDGRSYWDTWVAKAKHDPTAAATVRRYYVRPAEELYDVIADPWEQKNLAADPVHAGVLAELRADLDAWMAETGDKGMATERLLRDSRTAEPKGKAGKKAAKKAARAGDSQ